MQAQRHNISNVIVSDFLFMVLFSSYSVFAHLDARRERSKVKQIPSSPQQAAFQLDSRVYATGQAAT